MKIGDYLQRLSGAAQYSPIFGRGGQNVLLSADVLDVPGSGVLLNIDVEHKNSEDTTWTAFGSFAAISATGVNPPSPEEQEWIDDHRAKWAEGKR